MARVLIERSGRKIHVNDEKKDFHTQFGFFTAKDLQKKAGSVIASNTGAEATIFDSFFVDAFEKIGRGPQVIPPKDIGLIITKAGIGKDSVVVDAGAGSGALACTLGHVAKKVTTYEIREDFFKTAKKNIEYLGLKNVMIKNKDVTKGIDEKNVDAVTLDMATPWEAIPTAKKALKPGGFIISYSPTIPQVMDFLSALDGFTHLQTVELIEREWEVAGRKVRPKTQQFISHSGFITFARKL